ncbi:MAG: hypothetical protein IPP72_04495 [Chitinophagaceae bacterium]|nr:hypothetical protein [Chitinophagaceae bacterium]
MHSITQEELLQYMYAETSIEKTAAIKAALQTDWNLREQYEVLVSAQQNLEKVTLAPRKKAIDFILNYANKQVKEFTEQ